MYLCLQLEISFDGSILQKLFYSSMRATTIIIDKIFLPL